MSYDLVVNIPEWPDDVDGKVCAVLAAFGAHAVFHPRASLRAHEGGWFPLSLTLDERTAARVGAADAWCRPTHAGFELYVSREQVSFAAKSDAGSGAAHLVAMALAHVVSGRLMDPQVGLEQEVRDLESALAGLEAALPAGWSFADVCDFPDDPPPFEAFEG